MKTTTRDHLSTIFLPLSLFLGASSSVQAWTAASSSRKPYHHYHNDHERSSSSLQPQGPYPSTTPPQPQQKQQQSLYVPSTDELAADYGIISPLLHSTPPEWATRLDDLDLTGSSSPDDGCSPPATIRLGEAVKIRNSEDSWEPFYVSIETTDEQERFQRDLVGVVSPSTGAWWFGLQTSVTSGILAPKGGSGRFSDEVTIVVEEEAGSGLSTLAPLYLVVRTQNDYWSWRISSGNNLRLPPQHQAFSGLRP